MDAPNILPARKLRDIETSHESGLDQDGTQPVDRTNNRMDKRNSKWWGYSAVPLQTLGTSALPLEVGWSHPPGSGAVIRVRLGFRCACPQTGAPNPQIQTNDRSAIATAPRFTKLLYDLAGARPTEIVLDLTELDFMDASGLNAMAGAAQRLPPSSLLTLRSPSALIERLLTITGLQDVIHVERPHRGTTLAAEQHAGDRSSTVPSAPPRLISDLRVAATMPANDEVIDAALRLVVGLAADQYETDEGPCLAATREGH